MTATTTDTPTLRPAMPDEAWKLMLATGTWPMPSDHGTHAMAALALHEQPFGFGWQDHDLLIDLAGLAEREAEASESQQVSVLASLTGDDRDAHLWGMDAAANRRRAADLRSIAARIAALLAPR